MSFLPPLNRRFFAPAATAALLAALASVAHAQNSFYKTNSEAATLVTAAAWVNVDNTPIDPLFPANGVSGTTNSATSTTDIWVWDNRVDGTDLTDGVQNVSVGNDTGFRLLSFRDPAVPVVIDGGGNRTITLTSVGTSTDPLFPDSSYGGIDMSAATQDLTIQNLNPGSNVGLRLGGGSQTFVFNVAAGRTLTINSPVAMRSGASNSIVKFTGAGRTVISGEFKPSHAIINAGEVEFSRPGGNSRIATASPNPPSYTQINGGTLIASNTSGSATGAGPVAVNDTATLAGSGIVSGTVTAASGSTLSPGRGGVGTLQVGSLVMEAGSNLVWEAINEVDADRLNVSVTDGLTINGGVIHLHNPGTTTPFTGTGVFNLIGYSGAIGGAGLNALSIAEETKISGKTYTLGLGAGVITLEISDGSITPVDWAVNANGNWSTGSNWTGEVAPDAVKALARIPGSGTTFTAPRTVTLDAPRTVGKLLLESTQTTTLAGSSALTFNQDGAAATLFSGGSNHVVQTPLVLTAGGLTTTVDGAGETLTLSNTISGDGHSLVKIGDGTLLLTADNTYTGDTSVSAGTLQIGSGGVTGSVAGPISVSGTLRFDRSGSVAITQPISGTGDVVFAGTGDTTLTVPNTYSGDTTLSAGTLVLADGLALQNSTFTYSNGGGALTIADPVVSVTLGALAGDRPFPLTNTLGTPVSLTVGGNGETTLYTGIPSGSGASFTKAGSGTFSITGTHTYAGDTTVSAGVLSIDAGAVLNTAATKSGTTSSAKLLVNGGTLNTSASSEVRNGTGGIVVTAGGVANFPGGIINPYSESANAFIHVNGGTLNAASISLGRGNASNTSAAAPGSAASSHGLYINNNGVVNITGAFDIGNDRANSSVHSRMDSGSLTVGGPLTISINNTGRWSILDISGGTLTSTDTAGGIFLGGPHGAGRTTLIVRDTGVVKAERIQFGQSDFAGWSYLQLTSGALYVGSGGLVLGSTAPSGTAAGEFEAALRIGNGTLGALADWSTTIPVSITGVPTVVTGSDESDIPHAITLHGTVSGPGFLTKSGSGSVRMTSPNNLFEGEIIVQGGHLGLGGSTHSQNFYPIAVNEGASFGPEGTFTAAGGFIINGALVIDYNSAAETPVGRLETPYDITLGANSSLTVSGSGLLPGPAYVIAKASFGISGTFANVSLPDGFTLDYNYDDGSGTPAIAIVGASVGSPYDNWAASFSLAGPDADTTADPDGDGLVNLLEYALSTSPVAGDSADAHALARSGNFLTLTFDHPADNSLTYTIEATNDLAGTWSTVHTFLPFTTPGTETYTDTADLTVTPRRFLRLKVTATP